MESPLFPDYNGMKQLLDHLKINYWLVDPQFVLLDTNETFLDFTGASREKLMGRDMLTLVEPQEAETIRDRLITRPRETHEFELYVYARKNKVKIPIRFHLAPNFDPKGNPISYNVLLSDISALKDLEAKKRELNHVRRQIRQSDLETRMIGSGKAMETVFYAILRCADVESPVLITGETGVGKEVAARAIHGQSNRCHQPFVAVNCGALPGALLESELFGHVKGAFTGAIAHRTGLFREAQGGTLFLDEIGDMEKHLQVKLLRAIQENEVRPVGDDTSHPVDLRIICATNHDLEKRARTGKFRLDLYYRISVVPIHIPPLRKRPEDIIKLARQFIQGKGTLSPKAAKCLCRYQWPGNIRELQNAMEHALVMGRGKTILPEALPEQVQNPIPRGQKTENSFKELKDQAEKTALEAALEKHRGNQSAAARDLGISRTTLWRKKALFKIP